MDLEEIKTVWSEMSDQLEKQKKLTNEIILKMTQERYTNKIQRISTYETIGAILCFAMALVVLFNFAKLDIWYLMVCGVFTFVYLLVLPILVLRSITSMKKIKFAKDSYKEALIGFTKAKKQFLFIQRMGIYLGFILVFTSLPVASKIMKNKDLFLENEVLRWYFPIMAVFLFFFGRWGYNCYRGITNSAENILKELE